MSNTWIVFQMVWLSSIQIHLINEVIEDSTSCQIYTTDAFFIINLDKQLYKQIKSYLFFFNKEADL